MTRSCAAKAAADGAEIVRPGGGPLRRGAAGVAALPGLLPLPPFCRAEMICRC